MSSSVFHRKMILKRWESSKTEVDIPSRVQMTIKASKVAVPENTCKPCRLYTKKNEKPSWAIHGCPDKCPGKGHKNKVILQPQLPAEKRPKRGWPIRNNLSGFSCVHPECQDYNKVYPSKQGAQQHAKKHYPPEYKCSECDGEWYTKGEYNYHFWIPCSHCGELVKKGSQSAHEKNCPKK
mgnify:FL=1